MIIQASALQAAGGLSPISTQNSHVLFSTCFKEKMDRPQIPWVPIRAACKENGQPVCLICLEVPQLGQAWASTRLSLDLLGGLRRDARWRSYFEA